MTDDFRERLQDRLTAFRVWRADRPLLSCRLVQHTGDSEERTGAIDVPLDEIESEITGALCEGFGVDWNINEGQSVLYLVVWEPENLPWTWREVFALTDPTAKESF